MTSWVIMTAVRAAGWDLVLAGAVRDVESARGVCGSRWTPCTTDLHTGGSSSRTRTHILSLSLSLSLSLRDDCTVRTVPQTEWMFETVDKDDSSDDDDDEECDTSAQDGKAPGTIAQAV